jgi:Zn-finger nucleic acid-binding protein
MQCPVCNVELKMSERESIEIDYCPQCRGVWLDRGELDKIIERSRPAASGVADRVRPGDRERLPDDRIRYRLDDDDDDDYRYGRRRRRSFLDDLFDFD